MIEVSILGTGNVAWHLAKCLSANAEIKLKQILGRTTNSLNNFREFAPCTTDFSDNQAADILIIAVSDSAISQVSKRIKNNYHLVVHCSGSTGLEALEPLPNRGVLYPLQTFSKGFPVDWKQIPLCLEVYQEENRELLLQLAKMMSDEVIFINSEKRKTLHLAAVFVNNFGNHLLASAEKICAGAQLPFDILRPLAEETLRKAFALGPEDAQTGPAKRGDYKSLKNHINLVKQKDQETLYKELTNSILKKYGREEL